MSTEWTDAAAEADLWDGAGTSVLVHGRDIAEVGLGRGVGPLGAHRGCLRSGR